MMNSRPRSASRSWRSVIGFFGVLLLVVLYAFRTPISYTLHLLSYSVGKVIWPSASLLDDRSSASALQSQIVELKAELSRDQAIADENALLKGELGHISGGREHLAIVLSVLRSSPYDTILIDQGSASGVTLGQRVVSESGVAIGEVVESYDNLSKVLLYSAYGRQVEANLPDGTHMIVSGAGGQNFIFKLPTGIKLTDGALITLPSADNLVLAQIEKSESASGDVFQTVYARSPVNIFAQNRVYVEN